MCGGRGKRLGKLTENLPKPLIKIGDKTILELKLRNYIQQGFNNFILCVGYKGDLIKEAVKQFGLTGVFKFSDEGEPAGILKRLYMAKDLFDERIIVTYGDTHTDINLLQLYESHIKSDNEATIVVAPIQNPFGLVLPFLQGIIFLLIGFFLLSFYFPKSYSWIERHTEKYPKLSVKIKKVEAWIRKFIGEV